MEAPKPMQPNNKSEGNLPADRESNKQLALRVKGILEKNVDLRHSFAVNSSTFEDDAYGNDVLLSVFSRNAKFRNPNLPEDFNLPGYEFRFLWNSNETLIDTPYGQLKSPALGANGYSPWIFKNYYWLNEAGQGFRVESVSYSGVTSLNDCAQRLNFNPEQKDSRAVPLEKKDYEKIKDALDLIENGAYKKRSA